MKKVKSNYVPINPRSPLHRRYNWRPDKPDMRDHKFSLVHPSAAAAVLPSSIDLKPYCPPVFDQGDMGSCTGNALAGAFDFVQLKELRLNQPASAAPEEFGSSFSSASRLFIYWYERFLEGDTNQDGGAELRDGVKVLNTWGCCPETTWPYANANLLVQPNSTAMAQAAQHKISTYSRLETLTDMKACLASGFPFVFGFTVYESFESAEVAASGDVPLPSPNEGVLGGHAVMAVGYNDAKQWFTVRNSWGTGWGIGGYFHMPYAYLTNGDLASDFWTIRR
jgi:C1A family cysteine protease